MQIVKRLAQVVVDLDKDVFRMHHSLSAFTRVAQGKDIKDVEATLSECMLVPLRLSSIRLFEVDTRQKRAFSVSGPPASVEWKAGPSEQRSSLVAW